MLLVLLRQLMGGDPSADEAVLWLPWCLLWLSVDLSGCGTIHAKCHTAAQQRLLLL
jgi:hypothetical protein